MTPKKIIRFFDKLEDRTRARLSRSPMLYAFLGAIGIVLFWRGIWHLADDLSISAILSILIGVLILLVTGVFVSAFVGSRLIISGLSGDKKLAEKTVEEIETEENQLKKIQNSLNKMEVEVSRIEQKIDLNK